VWSEVLDQQHVGMDDNFFEIGGDSIRSIQLVGRAREKGFRVSVRQLFEHPTVGTLAAALDAAGVAGGDQGILSGPVEFTPVQKWFFEQQHAAPHFWNQSVVLRLPASFEAKVVRTVLESILQHHDALRTRFSPCEAGWTQVTLPSEGAAWWSETAIASTDLLSTVIADTQASLDLTLGPLCRASYVRVASDGSAHLIWVVHHLVVDGVSWRVLLQDLEYGYRQVMESGAMVLPPKSASFQRWASELTRYAHDPALRDAELAFWEAQVTDMMPVPVDGTGPNTYSSSEEVVVALTEEETQTLVGHVPRILKATVEELLLSALGRAYGEWTGSADVVIEIEGHGREQSVVSLDVTRTVGWFTTQYPLRLSTIAADAVSGVADVARRLRAVPNRGLGYGALRYLAKVPELNRPRPQLGFNYLGQIAGARSKAAGDANWVFERGGPSSHGDNLRPYVLEIGASVSGGRLRLFLQYSKNLHSARIERLAEGILDAVRQLLAAAAAPGHTVPTGGASARSLAILRRQLTETN
jgi:non-ribosomal peptide synthase protein (TIGR01720 family)